MTYDLALGSDQGGPMNMFVGGLQVQSVVYVDDDLNEDTLWVMPVITISTDIGDNGLISEVAAWVDEIPIVGPFLGAGIAWLGSLIQMLIPDGVAAVLGTITSTMRSEGTTATDDNFVEVVVGSVGYQGLITDVLAHYPEDGSSSQGLGFRLVDSTLSIVQRSNIGLGPSTAVVEGCGLYTIGDTIRLETYAELHYHTLLRNGWIVGIYDDLGGLTLGAGYRTVALSMQAEIATEGGARSTSPNFVSLIAGDLQTSFSLASGGSGSAGGADGPTVTATDDDAYDFSDVSADPGGAGSTGGADQTSSYTVPGWIVDL